MERETAASRGAIVPSVVLNCACAREVSSSVPRPASRRALVRSSVDCWFVHVAARDVELALLAAQLEVRARDFGDHDDLRVVQVRFGGTQVGVARFDVATDAAEEVELPHRIEAGVVVLDLAAHRPGSRPAAAWSTSARCSRRTP